MAFLRSMSLGAVIDVGVGASVAAVGRLSSAVNTASQSLTSLGGKGLGMLSKGLGVASLAGAGLSLTLGAVATAGIASAASFEQTKIAFTTMLGSAEKANDFLGQIDAFAAKTPFESKDLYAASRQMLAFGFAADDVLPTLSKVGDAVSAMAGGPEEMERVIAALGKIKAKGKASAEEMNMLLEVGVFGWKDLAKSMGVTSEEAMAAVTAGAVNADMITQAFFQHSTEAFGGMMDAQSHSFLGMLSNVSDAADRTARTIFGPVIEAMKPMIDMVNAASGAMDPSVVRAIGDGMGSAVKLIGDLISQAKVFFGQFSTGAGITQETAHQIGFWVAGISAAIVVATPLLGVLAALAAAGALVGEALVPIAGVIAGGVLIAIGLVTAGLATMQGRGMGFGDSMSAVMSTVIGVWTHFRDAVTGSAGDITTTFAPALSMLWQAWNNIASAFGNASEGSGSFLETMADFVGLLVGVSIRWAGFVASVIAGALSIASFFVSTFGPAMVGFAQGLASLFMGIMSVIPALIGAATQLLMDNPVTKFAIGVLGIDMAQYAQDHSPIKTRDVDPKGNPLDEIMSSATTSAAAAVSPDVPAIQNKITANVSSTLKLDGKDVARSTKKVESELTERAGFSVTPWQRRQILEQGATLLPTQ